MVEYQQMYQKSIKDPKGFWSSVAQQFYWKNWPQEETFDYNFNVKKGQISVKWMKGATTNICYNMIDINIEKGLGNKIAFYW